MIFFQLTCPRVELDQLSAIFSSLIFKLQSRIRAAAARSPWGDRAEWLRIADKEEPNTSG
jgi:hypothetical protein